MQSIRLNQHFETKPTSLEEMPLFVGKPLVNMSAYKEFVHAI
jgi:phage replication initiation protein